MHRRVSGISLKKDGLAFSLRKESRWRIKQLLVYLPHDDADAQNILSSRASFVCLAFAGGTVEDRQGEFFSPLYSRDCRGRGEKLPRNDRRGAARRLDHGSGFCAYFFWPLRFRSSELPLPGAADLVPRF